MPFSDIDLPIKSNQLLASYRGSSFSSKVLTLYGSNTVISSTVAERISRYHLCRGVKDLSCPCYDCRLGADHPDLKIIKPSSSSGRILVGDLADTISFLKETSITSDKRCLVVLDASGFIGGAAADLLSILEVKLEGVLILFTVSNINTVPATIRSRTACVFTGDVTKSSALRNLLSSGIGGKKAEDLSRLAPQVSTGIVNSSELVYGCIATTHSILSHVYRGNQLNALNKVREFMSSGSLDDLGTLLEVMHASVVDIQKARFTAQSQLTVPSKLDWYQGIRDLVDDETLLKTAFAIRRALTCLPQHRRAMLLWCIGVISAVVETHKKESPNAL